MPRQRYNVRTPQHIVDIAARIFAERGFRAVTVKDIVKAAGVNVAAVNYHFGDKEQLYRAVVRHNLQVREASTPIVTPSKEQLPAQERLRDFIHTLMIQLLDDKLPSVMSRLMLWEAIDPTPVFGEAVDALPRRQLKILDAVITDLLDKGHARAAVRRYSISILGQCVYYRYGLTVLQHIDPGLRFTPQSVHAIAGHIYEFSLAAIRGCARRATAKNRAGPRIAASAPVRRRNPQTATAAGRQS